MNPPDPARQRQASWHACGGQAASLLECEHRLGPTGWIPPCSMEDHRGIICMAPGPNASPACEIPAKSLRLTRSLAGGQPTGSRQPSTDGYRFGTDIRRLDNLPSSSLQTAHADYRWRGPVSCGHARRFRHGRLSAYHAARCGRECCSDGSTAKAASRSGATRSGITTTRICAAQAARMPLRLSSNARQSCGG